MRAEGENITVRGRGILDGNEYPHLKGPGRFMLDMTSCKNLVVRDVILRGSWTWALVPNGCDGVLIDDVKICGSRVLNDDGIDLVNSCDVTIRNCFIRTQDDCIAIKGLTGHDRKACEKMTIEACEFWTDLANVFRIGYECETELMQDLTARDIDVLHYSPTYRKPEEFWSPAVFAAERRHGDAADAFRHFDQRRRGRHRAGLARPMVCAVSGGKYARASLGVRVQRHLCDRQARTSAEMRGRIRRGTCSRDLTFENVVRFGSRDRRLTRVTIGDHTQYPV